MATIKFSNEPNEVSVRLDRFKAAVEDMGGPAKSCRFMVTFEPRRSIFSAGEDPDQSGSFFNQPYVADMFRDDFPFLCEVAEFPGRMIETMRVRYYGPEFKLPTQTVHEDLNLTFIVRSRAMERQVFDDWMNEIHPNDTYYMRYRESYSCDINIWQFSDTPLWDERGNATHAQYHWKLHDAYPILVNPQPVTWADSEFLRLGVSFAYTRWTRPGIDRQSANTAFETGFIAGARSTR